MGGVERERQLELGNVLFLKHCCLGSLRPKLLSKRKNSVCVCVCVVGWGGGGDKKMFTNSIDFLKTGSSEILTTTTTAAAAAATKQTRKSKSMEVL